jgi:CheY-like chemotaxis protein
METKRILIIDDEERIREVVKASLEDLGGWNAIAVESAQEGLLKINSEPFDAIVLDVSMPDMDGYSFFEKLQKNSATQSIPVIFLTAKVLWGDRDRFARLGVMGVINKPFNPVTLSRQIAEILGWNL